MDHLEGETHREGLGYRGKPYLRSILPVAV